VLSCQVVPRPNPKSRPPPESPPRLPPPPAAGEAEAAGASEGARRRRSDGEKSHREILLAAARLASTEGLDGLSIGALAKRVGLSKSGLFAHFRSKEELQLETIGVATEIFGEEVVAPAMRAEGLARVRALVGGFLDHVGRGTFPGGCFFASVAAEVDSHPGALRDRIAAMNRNWFGLFRDGIREAQHRGELDAAADPTQVAFEVNAMLQGGHTTFLLQGDVSALDRARRGTESVLALYGAKSAGTIRRRRG
jgi:AcrR family transcriptional regulator